MLWLLTKFIFAVDFPEEVRIELVIKLSDIEQKLMVGSSEKIQLSALIAAFSIVQRNVAKLAEKQS